MHLLARARARRRASPPRCSRGRAKKARVACVSKARRRRKGSRAARLSGCQAGCGMMRRSGPICRAPCRTAYARTAAARCATPTRWSHAGLVAAGSPRRRSRRSEARYAVAIPPALQALIATPDDPIGRQFVPDPAELVTAPHERADPIGDDALSPVQGHRAPLSRPRAAQAAAGLPGLLPLLLPPRACRPGWRRCSPRPSSTRPIDWLRAPPGDPRGDPDRRRPADAVAAPARRHRRRACRHPACRDAAHPLRACRSPTPARVTDGAGRGARDRASRCGSSSTPTMRASSPPRRARRAPPRPGARRSRCSANPCCCAA